VEGDATIIESHKREAQPHYEGGRGYQPVVAYWVEQRRVDFERIRAHAEKKREVDGYKLARALHDAALAPLAGLRLAEPLETERYRAELFALRNAILRTLGPPGDPSAL
jgi:hypothetical protein